MLFNIILNLERFNLMWRGCPQHVVTHSSIKKFLTSTTKQRSILNYTKKNQQLIRIYRIFTHKQETAAKMEIFIFYYFCVVNEKLDYIYQVSFAVLQRKIQFRNGKFNEYHEREAIGPPLEKSVEFQFCHGAEWRNIIRSRIGFSTKKQIN